MYFIENSLFISIWTGNYCVVYFSGRAVLINFKEDKRERDRVPYSTIDLPSELYTGEHIAKIQEGSEKYRN